MKKKLDGDPVACLSEEAERFANRILRAVKKIKKNDLILPMLFLFFTIPSIEKYLNNNTPTSDYSPYIISGQSIGDGELIMKSIDTCAPKAPHFGVPEENVY